VQTPHQTQSVLKFKGHQSLTGGRFAKHQALLRETPEAILKTCNNLNLATLLPVSDKELTHSCTETIDQIYSNKQGLKDQSLNNPDEE
jgi:hypothetical protein